MAPRPLPYIAEEHYDAIRRVAADLPEEYTDWLQLIGRAQRKRGRPRSVQLVPVLPVEFVTYCLKQGLQGRVNTLLLFASDKASGSGDTDQDDGLLEQRH